VSWTKSSYSADVNCVEVAWTKSSHSLDNGTCVEVAQVSATEGEYDK
jgi:hypothetical protein